MTGPRQSRNGSLVDAAGFKWNFKGPFSRSMVRAAAAAAAAVSRSRWSAAAAAPARVAETWSSGSGMLGLEWCFAARRCGDELGEAVSGEAVGRWAR